MQSFRNSLKQAWGRSGSCSKQSEDSTLNDSCSAVAVALPRFLHANDNADEKQAEDRRHLVHQEAVAGLLQNYASAFVRAVEELSSCHSALEYGLRQAGDIVADSWADRAAAISEELRQHAETAETSLADVRGRIADARREHRSAACLSVVSEGVARRRNHYDEKIRRLRIAAEEAKGNLSSGALDPGHVDGASRSGKSSGGTVPMRSFSGLKTMHADLKLGRLVRNEEKLLRIVSRHEEAEAAAAQAMEHSLTVGRRRLREAVDTTLRTCIEQLLPGIADVVANAAESAAKSNQEDPVDDIASGVVGSECPPGSFKSFAVGDRVLVTGLASAPQYNDHCGIVQNYRDDGRLEVTVRVPIQENQGSGQADASKPVWQAKVLALRPENLVIDKTGGAGVSDLHSWRASDEFLVQGGGWLGLGQPGTVLGGDELESMSVDDSSDGD
eukprot:TRINITY_DN11845_c0_g1_i1.p1 TRINITY_DN11845_c0_g1~~TRINITY_DN11845_c0_g1_i1.p1  ORF type:complete len:444 (-),score=84.14 TRINITY_DN11845_c0_g1_i1:321-1652(-)